MTRQTIITIFVLVCCLLSPMWVMAQDNLDFSHEDIEQLYAIQQALITIDDLQARGLITDAVAAAERDTYLDQAEAIIGHRVTAQSLGTILADYAPSFAGVDYTLFDRIRGALTFVNVIWVIASIFIVTATGWLARLYLFPILRLIPASVYEALFYVVCLFFILIGRTHPNETGQFVAMPGVLGLIGALKVSHARHGYLLKKLYGWNTVPKPNKLPFNEPPEVRKQLEEEWKAYHKAQHENVGKRLDLFAIYSFIVFVVWAIVAVIYESSLIGFLAVIALQDVLGFLISITPIYFFLGFTRDSYVPRAMSASLLMLVFYTVIKISGNTDSLYFDVFSTGVFLMGAFVYFIGLLLVSSRWYGQDHLLHYVQLQALAIVSALIGYYVGNVYGITQLQGIVGTFTILYTLQKYSEIVNWTKHRAWALLGLGILLYLISLLVNQNPQYFFFIGTA